MTVQVTVVGGGLAGIAAALECADRGARVTLLERKRNLGGLTWSFRHGDMWVDNGQHVFLRCCTDYLSFLDRIGSSADVEMPGRLDIPVVAPGAPGAPPVVGRLQRSSLPPPLHLAGSLIRYPHLPLADRLGLARAISALRRLRLDDPSLDEQSFGDWLQAHGQSVRTFGALWDLIVVPTVNLPSSQASLAMAAKVFKTGLLDDNSAADIGWSKVPLGTLHGERSLAALQSLGVDVRTGVKVGRIAPGTADSGWRVQGEGWELESDGVVLALAHEQASTVLPAGALPGQDRLGALGSSAIVDVHLVFDRPVTAWPLMAAVNSPVQWVFDRTASSGLKDATDSARGSRAPQYLAVSLSAADALLGRRPEDLIAWIHAELSNLLPAARYASLVDSLVTKERRATFAARPGSGAVRPAAATRLRGLSVAGSWTDTGWPATMEGAVRSGRAAARACLATARVAPERHLADESLPPSQPHEEVA